MYFTGNGRTTNTIGFGTTIHIQMGPPPKPPCCHVCAGPPERQTPDRKLWCCRCLIVDQAPNLFELLFSAVAPEQRTRLYRALAAAFHPDVGGDERVMQFLNTFKERF